MCDCYEKTTLQTSTGGDAVVTVATTTQEPTTVAATTEAVVAVEVSAEANYNLPAECDVTKKYDYVREEP